jgi:hypothetical protein
MKVRATGEQKGCIGSGVPMCNRMDMARVTNCKRRNHCSQDRVLVCRIVRSYIPRHLNRASTLLRFVFALFSSVCSVFLLFSLFFLCFLFVSSVFPLLSLLFCLVPLFSCIFFLNSINNLPILLTNRATTLVFTIFHQPTDPT